MIFFFCFVWQHGVFMEVCNHDQCGCGSEVYSDNLKLVNPVSWILRAKYFWIGFFIVLKDICHLVHIEMTLFLPSFQVMPISSFICHCEITWMRMLRLENDCKNFCENNQLSFQSCQGRFYGQSVKKILTSEDIGIILLGSLKVSNWCLF